MKIDINKYLGKWHEIARIKNGFEKNMNHVTAIYSLNEDNTIKIINSGYIDDKYYEITGTAFFTDKDDVLKISFFKNFTSNYNILAIDKDYKYALVGGEFKNYLWILSRTKTIPKEIFDKFIEIAKDKKYNVDKLSITKQ